MLEDKSILRNILFVKCFIKGFVGNYGITSVVENAKIKDVGNSNFE